MILRVGLTGGLASGKSTVARALANRGIPVLDADRIVHDLYRPGAPGSQAIAEEFGPGFLDADGAVDRPRLAAHVFADAERVKRLNARIHPLVHEEQRRWLESLERSGARLGVVEATLLIESGGRERFDVIVTVSAPEALRLERAARRSPGTNADELRRRIGSQMPDAEREKVADVVIVNDGSEGDLAKKADDLARTLLERVARTEIR